MATSNLAILTNSHKIIALKKRAKRDQVKEVLFDEGARREFLTGFHKRKVQKHEAAKKKAIEREKQERLDNRREKRQLLAERAVENAAEVEKAYGGQVEEDDSEDEWAGIGGSSKKGKERAEEKEEEYEDEEQLATVTVVEDFDPEALLHGPDIPRNVEEETSLSTLPPTTSRTQKTRSSQERNGGIPTAMKKIRGKASTKPKDIKYQTKSDRKSERSKQQKRRTEKAQLAGGKASRKKIGGRGKR
ncbi:hypothetical protein PHLCEN_2v3693 [Hermanssonia centrifuga]|uniref:Nucleolar protein 12 n=1 Tax=Hermanssonia centrifuga TaxID=98765 RepID=A0A2R6QEM7_9APHY|nr:hypothetical protein PHLCEN_2v3693 [Hermanssonia centrifuga]